MIDDLMNLFFIDRTMNGCGGGCGVRKTFILVESSSPTEADFFANEITPLSFRAPLCELLRFFKLSVVRLIIRQIIVE